MNKVFLISFFLLLTGGICAQQATTGTLTLKEAEQRFLERNLSLIAERYNIDMAQAQVLQARLFENPVISLEQNVYNRLNGKYFDFGKEGETVVEVEQVIRLAGQRNKQIKLEKINKEIAEYQFEEVMRTLRQELNEKFVQIYFLSKSISIYEKEVNSLQELLAGMKLQQKKGNISLMEMSRLESMLFSLKKEKNERENELLTLRGELNVLLNLPGDAAVKLSLDEEVLKQLDLSQLSFADLKAMVNERPDLKIARSTVSASRANLKLQKSMAFPEFSVKGNYDRAGNFINNYFAVGVSLSVPIFNRNQGNIKAARFSIQQAGAEQENAANRGGVVMPWHHQLDLKFMQDFYLKVGGKRHTLQFGVDIKNFLNLLNSDWGLYKTVNNTNLLAYDKGNSTTGEGKGYTFQKNSGKRLTETYTKYKDFRSTYSVQFSLRYIFH